MKTHKCLFWTNFLKRMNFSWTRSNKYCRYVDISWERIGQSLHTKKVKRIQEVLLVKICTSLESFFSIFPAYRYWEKLRILTFAQTVVPQFSNNYCGSVDISWGRIGQSFDTKKVKRIQEVLPVKICPSLEDSFTDIANIRMMREKNEFLNKFQ